METDEKLYMQGFNNGYLIAKHDPELAAKLTTQTNDQSDYFQGLVLGKQEYDKEVREWARSFTKGKPARDDKGLEKER